MPSASDEQDRCTGDSADPWDTGEYLECCDGLQKQVGQWSGSDWSYRCQADAQQQPVVPPVPTTAPSPPASGARTTATFLEWNVHYSNRNINGIANIIRKSQPDIVGLCELTASTDDMATALSHAMKRSFRVQPGRGGWRGYGTDIFFDADKWDALEGGVESVRCASRGGPRAANWVVLKERQTGKKLITGGLHTSYCAHGCDGLQECEIGHVYTKFEALKRVHGEDASIVWMGDLNRNMHTRIMQNLLQGRLGGRQVSRVHDLAGTQGNTYYSGGMAIDFILGEAGAFHLKRGGRTGQGTTGRHLNGADHFPIYAAVDLL